MVWQLFWTGVPHPLSIQAYRENTIFDFVYLTLPSSSPPSVDHKRQVGNIGHFAKMDSEIEAHRKLRFSIKIAAAT